MCESITTHARSQKLLTVSTNSATLVSQHNIYVFSCISAESCDKLRLEDEEASHYELREIFCSGDDKLASLGLDSIRAIVLTGYTAG